MAAAVVVGTTVFLLATKVGRRSGRLLDGTAVVLEKVGYGTTYSPPRPLLDRLLTHLPAKWLGSMHWKVCSGPSGAADRETFTFWLKFSDPAAGTQPIGYAVADENGFEARMIFAGYYGPYQPAGFGTNGAGLVRGAGIFPRCSKTFFLRLYQRDGQGKPVRVAEWPVRNSGFKTKPAWTPQTLPIDQQTNGLVVTLVKATVGIAPPGPVVAPYDCQAGQWSEFRFRVTEQGKPVAGWTISEMFISDAVGIKPLRISGQDLGSFNGQFNRIEGDEVVCVHRWDFWTGEPAWQLRVHFEHSAKPGCWAEYLVRPEFLTLAAPHRPR